MAIVGLISDTHGLLRPEAMRALAGSDVIIHAGDVGSPEILDALRAVAPVVAVRGNVDTRAWAAALPATAAAEAGHTLIYVVHDLNDLDLDPAAAGFGVVVSGHSHKPARSERAGVLFVNPGSAGRRRFKLPVTVARLDLERRPWKVEFIALDDGGALIACAGAGVHVGTQNGINARLVAAAVLSEPFDKIVVKPDCHAVFRRRRGELGGTPEGFVQLGNIGVVDVLVAHRAHALKVGLALRARP
jgi:uncharacterized protein